jgi:hypothetical protein
MPKKKDALGLAAALVLGTGCVGEIGGSGSPEGEATGESCAAPEAERSPLRRLTRAQYSATVRDLLDVAPPALDDFVDDEVREGFDVNVTAASERAVDIYRASAEQLAGEASARFGETVGCDWNETTCVASHVEAFGLRAYRRSLTDEEVAALVALYEAERDASDATTALQLVVQAMLMSPNFLYHVEIGRDGGAGVVELTGYEIASRLSYFLWGTMPDEALFIAAAKGALDTAAGVEAEALRMLADPKAADMIAEFQRQWLDLRALDDVSRDPEVFPDWDPALLASMQTETRTFFQEVLLSGDGRLDTLLTAPYSYVDSPLAAHYGADASEDFEQTALPDERAGFLTQGLFLVKHAYPTETSWVHRGKFVRERLLCATMPPPPPGVDFANTNDPNRLTNPECSGCHVLMDPIGKAFDRYDATGRYAEVDADDEPIPQSGEVVGSEVGTFESIVDLARRLAEDPEVHACATRSWSLFALGRALDNEACSADAIEAEFEASGHDVRALIVAITTSDAFRYTRAE